MSELEAESTDVKDLGDAEGATDDDLDDDIGADEPLLEDEKDDDVVSVTDTDTAAKTESSQPDKEQQEPAKEPEIDKARQQLQQKLATSERRIAALEIASAEQRQKAEQEAEQTAKDKEDPLETIERLDKELQENKAENAQLKVRLDNYDAGLQEASDIERVHEVLKFCDGKYGEAHRNQAIEDSKKEFARQGYPVSEEGALIRGRMPPIKDQLLVIKNCYADLRLNELGGGKATVTTTTVTPTRRRADTSKTGAVARNVLMTGSIDDVAEAMVKEGRFKDYNENE